MDEEFLVKRRYESMLLLATLKYIVLSRNIQVANLNNKTVTTNLNKSSQLLNKEYEKIDYYFFIQKFGAGKIFKYCWSLLCSPTWHLFYKNKNSNL